MQEKEMQRGIKSTHKPALFGLLNAIVPGLAFVLLKSYTRFFVILFLVVVYIVLFICAQKFISMWKMYIWLALFSGFWAESYARNKFKLHSDIKK